MKFKHPLARSAKVWQAVSKEGHNHDLLVIVTTLELDPEHKKYKPELVKKLQDAATLYLAENEAKASGYVMMNAPKA